MSSGITVSSEAIDKFLEIKSGKKTRYCFFHLSEDNTKIIPGESTLKPDKLDFDVEAVKNEWEQFCSHLILNKECCYAIYDLNYKKKEGLRRDRILLVSWCPDCAPVRKKMMYATTSKTVKQAFNGWQLEIQACEVDDLSFEELKQKVEKS